MKKLTNANPPAIGERLLTLREAAEVLRLTTRTVRKYLKRGEIKGKIIGKRWRFRRVDVDAFYENAPSESTGVSFGGRFSCDQIFRLDLPPTISSASESAPRSSDFFILILLCDVAQRRTFIKYNGGLLIDASLLRVVLHD